MMPATTLLWGPVSKLVVRARETQQRKPSKTQHLGLICCTDVLRDTFRACLVVLTYLYCHVDDDCCLCCVCVSATMTCVGACGPDVGGGPC